MTAAHAEDRDVGMALIVFIGRGKIHRPLIAPGRGKELMRRRLINGLATRASIPTIDETAPVFAPPRQDEASP